jgi:hypothetical protein
MQPRLASVIVVPVLTLMAAGADLPQTELHVEQPVHSRAVLEAVSPNLSTAASTADISARTDPAPPPSGVSAFSRPTFHEHGLAKRLVTASNFLRWSSRRMARFMEVTVKLEVRNRAVPGAGWHVRAAAVNRSSTPVHSLSAIVGARCRTVLDYRTIAKYRWRTSRKEPWRRSPFDLTDGRSRPVNFTSCRLPASGRGTTLTQPTPRQRSA